MRGGGVYRLAGSNGVGASSGRQGDSLSGRGWPDVYATGLAATCDCGPFFGSTVAGPVAARIIGDAGGYEQLARRVFRSLTPRTG